MTDCMEFQQTWEQFLHDYEFEDSRRIYTNGARLIPSFRVKQMMEHYLLKAKSEAIKDVILTLETAVEESDKYIREYEDSREQRAYNQAFKDAYNLVKEMEGE